ncbi:Carboxyl-terminal-processing protease [Hordeum vulgare]|nr:Carboxyl-terminal-processing protease [Hordeum vulgare]
MSTATATAASTATVTTVATTALLLGRMWVIRTRAIGGAVWNAVALGAPARAGGGGGGARTGEGEGRSTLLGGAVCQGLFGEDDAGEHRVEGQALIAKDDADGVQALVQAVEELSRKVHLGDGVVDVCEAVGEELETAHVLGDGEVSLLEIGILAVEEHETSGAIGKEVVLDLGPDGIGCGGADDMINEGIGESGVDP